MNTQPQIFQFNPDMASDSDFEPGELHHVVGENLGRLLDPRRTPVRLIAVHLETGMFEVEILDFEDRGAHWLHPFEEFGKYQNLLGSLVNLVFSRRESAFNRGHWMAFLCSTKICKPIWITRN